MSLALHQWNDGAGPLPLPKGLQKFNLFFLGDSCGKVAESKVLTRTLSNGTAYPFSSGEGREKHHNSHHLLVTFQPWSKT